MKPYRLLAACAISLLFQQAHAATSEDGVVGVGEFMPGGKTIMVEDAGLPSVDTYGIQPENVEYASLQGMRPRDTSTLLKQIPSRQSAGLSRELLIDMLMMPVLADGEHYTPKGWLLKRVDKLIRMGAYREALKLIRTVPENQQDEALAQRKTDVSLIIGDIEGACDEIEARLQDESTPASLFWPVRAIFCRLYKEETAQAELMINILQEQKPAGLPPQAMPLFTSWGVGDSPLPHYTPADMSFTPVLTAALKYAETSQTAGRIPQDYVKGVNTRYIPPAFAEALSNVDSLAIDLRLSMLEHAVHYDKGTVEKLRILYASLLANQGMRVSTPQLERASLLKQADEQFGQGQVPTVLAALERFKHDFSPSAARRILSKELREFSNAPSRYTLTAPLILDIAAFHLDNNDLSSAKSILRHARSQSGEDMQIAADAVAEATYLYEALHGEDDSSPNLGNFSERHKAETLWILRRLVTVKEAFGSMIPEDTMKLQFAAPTAKTKLPPPTELVTLQEAEARNQPAAVVLQSIQLLSQTDLPYTGDVIISRLISTYQQMGLPSIAKKLAMHAILNPPFEMGERNGFNSVENNGEQAALH